MRLLIGFLPKLKKMLLLYLTYLIDKYKKQKSKLYLFLSFD